MHQTVGHFFLNLSQYSLKLGSNYVFRVSYLGQHGQYVNTVIRRSPMTKPVHYTEFAIKLSISKFPRNKWSLAIFERIK
jgi:hypothetical protein